MMKIRCRAGTFGCSTSLHFPKTQFLLAMPADPPDLPDANSPDYAPELSAEERFQLELASHPHDAMFKDFFSQPKNAREIFQSRLPEAVAEAINWPTLALQPSSFVKRDLHQSHSDLLFTANLEEHSIFLYLLFEHQTTVDETMPLRLLAYMVEIWRSHFKQHPKGKLPPILPFVLHQGPDKWTVSTEFVDMIELPESFKDLLTKYQPTFQYSLLDLSQQNPKDEAWEATVKVALQLLKAARKRKQLEPFFYWLDEQVILIPDSLIRLFLNYALHADENLDVEKISRKLNHNLQLKSSFMSTAQKLRQEGRQEGNQEGRQEGVWIGKIQMLEEMLGVPVSRVEDFAGLTTAKLQSRFTALQEEYAARFKR